jgi:hypothetical protein
VSYPAGAPSCRQLAVNRQATGIVDMKFKLRTLFIILIAMATLAPVCVLSGGNTSIHGGEVDLSDGALVEVVGENAEIRVRSSAANTLKWDATLNNGEFVDFYTQSLSGEPVDHHVISATTSTGGTTTANSLIDIELPVGARLVIRTTNSPIVIDSITVASASLTTSDGKISVVNSSGDFDLNTSNSEVTVQGVIGQVNVATTNAHVWFDGIVSDGTNSISTTNGDIAVRLRNGSSVTVSGSTHNGDVTVNAGKDGVLKDDDTATLEHQIGAGAARLNITNGPGAIHINPDTIAVFDGDS